MNALPDKHFAATGPKPIYLDHHASTPVDARVADVMVRVMTTQFGNPNDRGHIFGEEAAVLIEVARAETAKLVGADPSSVVWIRSATVGAEAAISHAVRRKTADRPLRVSATTVEHRAVLDALAKRTELKEIEVDWIQVDGKARISMEAVRQTLADGCDLLCVMAANNEVGTVYPIEEIAGLARQSGVPFLVDATQAAGHIPLDMERWGISYLLLAAHKMYGPKGAAALVVGEGDPEDLRALEKAEGTPNVPAIAGFGEACRLRRTEMLADVERISKLRDRLEGVLLAKIEGLVINGDLDRRMGHNLHFSVPGIPNDAVVARLSRSVALSTGSACQWGTDEPSHVLRAMRLPDDIQRGAVRIGLGRNTSEEEIDLAAELIVTAIEDTRLALTAGARS
jgi:cysteine desulfurase